MVLLNVNREALGAAQLLLCGDADVLVRHDAVQLSARLHHGILPVSYTHLDVYKRQVQHRADDLDHLADVFFGHRLQLLLLNLSVIAARCHLPYRGEALAFRKASSLRQRLPY